MVYRATVERGRRRGRRNWAPFNWEGFKPCVVCEPPVSLPFVCISGLVVTRILRGAELINQDYGALSIWKAGIRPRWHPLARSLPRALLLSLGRSSRARRKLEFIEMHQPNPICRGVGGGGVPAVLRSEALAGEMAIRRMYALSLSFHFLFSVRRFFAT